MTFGNNLLSVRSLGMRFGGIQALTDVNFDIPALYFRVDRPQRRR